MFCMSYERMIYSRIVYGALVSQFLKYYYNKFVSLNNRCILAQKSLYKCSGPEDYQAKRKIFRAIDWDYSSMEQTPLHYKLQHDDEIALGVIDKVCRRYDSKKTKDNLVKVLQGKEPESRRILYDALMSSLRVVYSAKEDIEDKIFKAFFFLNQFPKIRRYIFARRTRHREINRFIDRFKKKRFHCFKKSTVKEDLKLVSPEPCERIKNGLNKLQNGEIDRFIDRFKKSDFIVSASFAIWAMVRP